MDEKILAMLGDRDAQERFTAEEVIRQYPYKNGAWARNPRLYYLWRTMIHRCENPRRESYERYGGRGISVCSEWHEANKFMDWAEREGYAPGLQLDRINNNGDYCPENCRWVTAKENARNTRRNRFLTISGERKTVAEWCEIYDVSPYTVYWWIKEKGEGHAAEMIQKRNARSHVLSADELERLEEME